MNTRNIIDRLNVKKKERKNLREIEMTISLSREMRTTQERLIATVRSYNEIGRKTEK